MALLSRGVRRPLLVALTLLLTVAGAWAAAPRSQADEQTKVLLLLDVSGSMNAKISSGGTKFAAAKRALKNVAASLPAGTPVGLRVYGSEIAEDQDVNPKACTDTRLVLPIGPLNQQKMNAAVDSFSAKGETPIAYSLGKAVDDLGDSGKRVLILISDGQETCAGDPCPTAEKLAKSGVDLQFNAIGLDVNSAARKQLQCIAKAGGGDYYDAGNTSSLDNALRKLTLRALRPFQITGTPVTGTPDPAAAPTIGVGQYQDRYASNATPRYYTLNRTPGSLVTVSTATTVKPYGQVNGDAWDLQLTTLGGAACGATTANTLTLQVATVITGAVRSANSLPYDQAAPGCATDPQLRFVLTRKPGSGSDATAPVELLVAEQAPATNAASLPAALTSYDGLADTVAASGSARTVVGGTSFSNAAQIGAGSWSDTVTTGETVMYKIPLDYGQRVRVTATVPTGSSAAQLQANESVVAHLLTYTPARLSTTSTYTNATAARPAKQTVASPTVRYRNAEVKLPGASTGFGNQWSTADTAGDYFVAVQIDPLTSRLTGIPLGLRLDVAVDGTPSGQPEVAVASSSPSPTTADPTSAGATPNGDVSTPPADTGRSTGTGLLVLGLAGGLVLAGIAAVGVWFVRHRRQGGPRAG